MTVIDRPGRPGSSAAAERPPWKVAAMPSEHGGWGLTLEPVLLGLIVAWSLSGLLLGIAALLAFLVRTPLKLAVIDRRRGRWLPRSQLAARIAAGELAVLAVLVAVVVTRSGWTWVIPVIIATPLVAVELWFDIRSRGRRMVPELCGAAGIAACAAAIALVGGESSRLAAALWLVLGGRAVGSIPFVRGQIARLRRGITATGATDAAQAVMVAAGVVAWLLDRRSFAGAIALVVIAASHLVQARHDPPPPKILGIRQMMVGFALVAVTATGVLAT